MVVADPGCDSTWISVTGIAGASTSLLNQFDQYLPPLWKNTICWTAYNGPFGKTHQTRRSFIAWQPSRGQNLHRSVFTLSQIYLPAGALIQRLFGHEREREGRRDRRGRRPAHPGENYPRPSPARHTANSRRGCGGGVRDWRIRHSHGSHPFHRCI